MASDPVGVSWELGVVPGTRGHRGLHGIRDVAGRGTYGGHREAESGPGA